MKPSGDPLHFDFDSTFVIYYKTNRSRHQCLFKRPLGFQELLLRLNLKRAGWDESLVGFLIHREQF